MIPIEKNIISINGNDFEYVLRGTKSPAIVLINGAAGPIEGWSKIWRELGRENVVFAYNRLGVGKSSKPKEPQSGNIMVKALRELLLSLNIEPPYLIVGHSLGGLIAHLFTVAYPDDALGLVFLEPSTFQDVLTDSKRKMKSDPTKFSEVEHVLTTVKQIQDAGAFPNTPILVVAGTKPAFGGIMPRATKQARINHQKELLALSGRGRIAMAQNSGHFPQLSEPDFVIREVNRFLKELISIEQKQDLTREDYAHIRELELLCRSSEKITFKLELDYKLADAAQKVPEDPSTNSNEFLWYDDKQLIGYIGISSFGGIIDPPELTGMVHPDHRRQGIFSSLLGLALEECRRRKIEAVLLLCDRNSISGRGFLDRIGAVYSYSEYEMRLEDGAHENAAEQRQDISIRRTSNAKEEETLGMTIWSAQKDGVIIGKVHLQLINGVGGIYGLSVLPENRGKGYGRPILRKAIETLREAEAQEILLQVNTENWIAHNLYKSCGFRETSVMDYFTLDTTRPTP